MDRSSEGKALNLDAHLGKDLWNRVVRIGVELEGGWSELPKDAKIENDGSVFSHARTAAGNLKRDGFPDWSFGEIPVGPMSPTRLRSALKKYWPTKIDNTCGMHVHMSFESVLQYSLLADSPDYQETVIKYMKKWADENLPVNHHIYERLSGANIYCQKKFWPFNQINQKKKGYGFEVGHRYTMISYSWERHRTVECRLLPMMPTQALAISAINHLLDITNAYLVACEKTRVKERVRVKSSKGTVIKLELRKGEVYEEFLED